MTKFSGASVKVGVKVTLVIFVLMLIAQVVFASVNSFGRLLLVERSVAVDNLGNIYAFGNGNGPYAIQKLDPKGNFVAKWGSRGTGDGQFNVTGSPNSIAVDSNNNVYVADKYQYRIQKFDSQGHFLTKWGSQGNGDGQFGSAFHGPSGLSLDIHNNVYVFDCGNYRIQKFDSQGHFLTKWGSQGNGEGQFNTPNSLIGGITTDRQGNVYVADTANTRIEKFDSNGHFLIQWGTYGSGPGQFGSPYEGGPAGLTSDEQLNIYAADTANRRIEKFDTNGHFLKGWSIIDVTPWPSNDDNYSHLGDLTIDKQGTLYTLAGIYNDTHDEIDDTGYYNVHLQTFDSQGHFLKRWSDPFYLPWWFVFTVSPAIGFLVSYLHAKRRNRLYAR